MIGAIFDGNAAGPGTDDPQRRDNSGTNFRINDPPLLLGEIQYIWNGEKGDPGLAGKFKVGGWRHLGAFPDQRFTASGASIASLPTPNMPANLTGDYGIYSVFEQQVYRVGNDDDRGIGVFARVSFSPSDRNLIDRYMDGGVEFVDLSDNRPKDKFGIAFGYAHVSFGAQALDVDFQVLMGPTWPRRTSESVVTAVYQYEVRSGWTLQPNFQYFIRPGGGATDPLGSNPGRTLNDAAVAGLRTVLKF